MKSNSHKWNDIKSQVYKRDNHTCRLVVCLINDELKVLKEKAGNFFKVLDPAHIFKVGSHPQIKFIPEYIVTLNRYSHSMLDSGKCPLTGKMIDPIEIESWWRRIVGTNFYDILKRLLNKSEKEINDFLEEKFRQDDS